VSILPDNILRRMDKSDRASLGKSGRTMAEVSEQAEAKSEHELQNQIKGLLARNFTAWEVAPWGRKNTRPAGTPDFEFYHNGKAYFIEAKSKTGVLSAAQKERQDALRAGGCEVLTADNYADAANFVKQIKQTR
jgi:hypothetical protein